MTSVDDLFILGIESLSVTSRCHGAKKLSSKQKRIRERVGHASFVLNV